MPQVLLRRRTFWHASNRITMLTLPVGGWAQPPSGTVGVDTPDTKRRLLNLARASGLMKKMAERDSAPAAEDQALLVHSRAYLDTLKAVSEVGGGELGMAAAQPRRPD